jgi:hypothetical protein
MRATRMLSYLVIAQIGWALMCSQFDAGMGDQP